MQGSKYNALHRYKRGDELKTIKNGKPLHLVIIEDYGTELFGASLKNDPSKKGFYDLRNCIYEVNRELY